MVLLSYLWNTSGNENDCLGTQMSRYAVVRDVNVLSTQDYIDTFKLGRGGMVRAETFQQSYGSSTPFWN